MKEMKTMHLEKNKSIFLICMVISFIVAMLFYNLLQSSTLSDTKKMSSIYSQRTESVINSIFHKTDVLAAVVKLKNGDIDEATFKSIAKIVYKKNAGIRGIQYMPAAVVTYSYPIKGNEAVIGKDFSKIKERKKDVQLAIDTKSIALSGPYRLIQGGLGVVARNPVFLTDASGNEYFWGFSAIVLDLPDAIDSVGLDHLKDIGYEYRLYSMNENSEKLEISGNSKLNSSNAIVSKINVPHHQWTLIVKKDNQSSNIMRALFVFLIGTLISIFIHRQYKLVENERKAINSKDEFFSDISHDMRTPLNAVIGFSTLAQLPETTEAEKDEYFKKIEISGKMLLDLVNDTLTASKISSGKLVLQRALVSNDFIVQSIVDQIESLADQKHVEFIIERNGYSSKLLMADKLNISKIFLNLLNNAVKFTPAGGHVWLTINEGPVVNQKYNVTVIVKDDGIGIKKEFVEKIFEPFYQEQRPGYEGMGTGLGLTIVKQIVKLLNGTISVESIENEGTTFIVTLPLEVADAKDEIQEKVVVADTSRLAGKKVLLCEDNQLNRQITSKLLEKYEIKTDEAENGKVGVDKFKASAAGEYAAILMDIRMPVMNGLEATKTIRKLKRKDAAVIPVIALSADVFAEDIKNCKDAGMTGHVAKPIDPQQLLQVLSANIPGNNRKET